jgi:hypothetical protein
MEITGRRRIAPRLHLPQTNREVAPMTDADYRAMASEIRDLIPLLLHAQSVADLRLLADRYERLAHDLQTVHGTLPVRLLEHRRQAS